MEEQNDCEQMTSIKSFNIPNKFPISFFPFQKKWKSKEICTLLLTLNLFPRHLLDVEYTNSRPQTDRRSRQQKNWSCCQWVCMSFHYFPNGYDDVSFNAYMKSRMWTSGDNVNGIYGRYIFMNCRM